MVAAAQALKTAAGAGCQRPGAMAADIVERAQHALAVTHQHQGHTGDLGQGVVARAGELGLAGRQLPAAGQHRNAITLTGLRIGVAAGRQGTGLRERLGRKPVGRGRRRGGRHCAAAPAPVMA